MLCIYLLLRMTFIIRTVRSIWVFYLSYILIDKYYLDENIINLQFSQWYLNWTHHTGIDFQLNCNSFAFRFILKVSTGSGIKLTVVSFVVIVYAWIFPNQLVHTVEYFTYPAICFVWICHIFV